jgi:hypothetical protein
LRMYFKIIVRTFPAIAIQLFDIWRAMPRGSARSAQAMTNSTVDNVITN